MRIISPIVIGAGILTATIPATAESPRNVRTEAGLAKALEGRIAGKAVDCLNLRDIRSSEIIDGTAILYRTAGNRIYVNQPDSGKETLRRGDVLVTDTHSSQLCSIDVVRLYDTGSRMQRGFVGLGKFVPYTKVRKNS